MDNYEDLSLDQLDQLDLDYFRRHRSNGGTSEFDLSINDISRARIEAFRRERGACFLSNINLQGRERDNPDYRFTPPPIPGSWYTIPSSHWYSPQRTRRSGP